ncbi:MAG: hypothetical protein H0T42_32820 [Deltaproteobacteria bacterium]|nr:hypothetical protein [Deltaproteobacteria bacterium]
MNRGARLATSTWTLAIVVAIAAVLLTLAYTLQYATLNQATYLLDPMQRAMPELFRRDWFVSETPAYLPVSGWLVQWLFVLDSEGATSIVIAHVVVTLATYGAIYALVTAATGGGLRAFLLVASFATVTKVISMGGSYLLVGYFQPSSLATLGWIVGMAALARDRYLLCGVAVALAGALHANFLVLGVGLFALSALARRDLTRADWAKLMVPQLVVLAVFAPSLLAASGPSEEAVEILKTFHAPIHYSPPKLMGWIRNLIGWQIGAAAALYLLETSKPARVLWRFSLVAFAIVVLSTLVIRFTPFESLTQVRWSRIAPFGQLACQVLIACALVRQAMTPRTLTIRTRIIVGLALLVPLLATGWYVPRLTPWPMIAAGAALMLLAVGPWPRIARAAVGLLAVVALAHALWKSPRGPGLSMDPNASADEIALGQWVQANTPTDALFLTPPNEYKFRLLARRSIIVDAKSAPLRPDLLVKWRDRLRAMVQFPDAATFQAVEARFAELTAAQLRDVARLFGAEYIVVNVPTQFPDPPLYRNDAFAIYRAGP